MYHQITLNMQEQVYEDQYAKHEKAAHDKLEKNKNPFNIFA